VDIKVVVLVKAAPVLTRDLDETMCVAGVRVDDGHHEWVRLHPVPFRDLGEDSKFVKYQTVTVSVKRSRTDRRPESWVPLHGSILPPRQLARTTAGPGADNSLGACRKRGCVTLLRRTRQVRADLWQGKDSVLFVGNQEQHPITRSASWSLGCSGRPLPLHRGS
jgi:hypothetical protein